MYCRKCGTDIGTGNFCPKCGTKAREKSTSNTKTEKSRLKSVLNEGAGFRKYQSTSKIIVLCLITFSIYYFVLFYRWIKAVNEESGKEYINPSFATLLNIITLGLAGIYFEYQLVKHAQIIIKTTNGPQNPKRKNIPTPMKNIKEIVLWGNIFLTSLIFASGGLATIVSIAGALYITVIVQRYIEYALCIKNPEAY